MKSTNLQFSVSNTSDSLHSFLMGTILGDGYITKRGALQVEHKDYAYTKWKFDFLREKGVLNPSTTISKVKRIHPKTQQESISYRFYTIPVFKHWRTLFYLEATIPDQKATKRVSKNIENLLVEPLSIAVWFMDDGGKGGNTPSGAIISVFKFSDMEIIALQNCIFKNFDICTNFHAPKSSRQLYIPKKEYEKWCNLVSSFIIPTQRYKLFITP